MSNVYGYDLVGELYIETPKHIFTLIYSLVVVSTSSLGIILNQTWTDKDVQLL